MADTTSTAATQLVETATTALSGGTGAVVGIAALMLGIYGALQLYRVVRSAMRG